MAMVIFGSQKMIKIGPKFEITEKGRFQFSRYDWFLLNTSQTDDLSQKMPNGPRKNMIFVSFCAVKKPNFELCSRIYARNSKKPQYGDISCDEYSKQIPIMISSYGETQANSHFSSKRHSKPAPQNWPKSAFFTLHPCNPHILGSDGSDSMGS